MNMIVKKPWGTYQVLSQEKNYLIKKIVVMPEGKLSLQSHQHRSEHWVIIQGFAKITIDGLTKQLKENQSLFIPKQIKHRIENYGKKDLIIIEVQFGDILNENDITRYEDIYNRK